MNDNVGLKSSSNAPHHPLSLEESGQTFQYTHTQQMTHLVAISALRTTPCEEPLFMREDPLTNLMRIVDGGRPRSTIPVLSRSRGLRAIHHPISEINIQAHRSSIQQEALEMKSVAQLIETYMNLWDEKLLDFKIDADSFDCKCFVEKLQQHNKNFNIKDLGGGVDLSSYSGFIEKYDLGPCDASCDPKDPNFLQNATEKGQPRFFVRADLHGDLKSLLQNLLSLQEHGFLDEQFKCKKGVHLVFLGDYCDRNPYGSIILEILMQLKEENPGQIHLIRGNHEDSEFSDLNRTDMFLEKILENGGREPLDKFYATLPLNIYISYTRDDEVRDYISCFHGLFEFYLDPIELLDHKPSGSILLIPKNRQGTVSARIARIKDERPESDPLKSAAKKVCELTTRFFTDLAEEENKSAYQWGDVSKEGTNEYTLSLSMRTCRVGGEHIKAYLDLSSEAHKVVGCYCGHGHEELSIHMGDKVCHRLTVGMDGIYAKRYPTQQDKAHLVIASREGWQKMVLSRKPNASKSELSELFPLNNRSTSTL